MAAQNRLDCFSKMPTPAQAGVLFAIAAVIVAVFSSLFTAKGPSKSQKSKGERAKEMRDAFLLMEKHIERSDSLPSMKAFQERGEPIMKVTQLWIYPIKSLRGCQVSSALLTRQGFAMDRKFMLLHVQEQDPLKLKNMHISRYPTMCLFHPVLREDKLVVEYRAPGLLPTASATSKLEIPLILSTFEDLRTVDVDMHHSSTTAYDMGTAYNDWFSKYFGFKVILAYYGGNTRQVLGNLPGRPATYTPRPRTSVSRILSSLPMIGPILEPDDEVIAFNDCAPYLVIAEVSTEDVSSRLPDGVDMDISKFRANVVLKGSKTAFDEDFWGEILLGDGARLVLTANCGRCVSLNVDYETGEVGTGRAGGVLKLLAKYSPIFGRYGFLSKASEGKVLQVGDKAVVSQRLGQRTKFYWPGLSAA